LRRFGSVQALRVAGIDEICDTRGIGPVLAVRIVDKLGAPRKTSSARPPENKRN